MKKHLLWLLAFVALLTGGAFQRSDAAGAQRLTMLVVPARYSVMQVAFDAASRYPCVLVSYQGDATTEEPLLHAWNGQEWVRITAADYAAGSFLQVTPSQTVLIGDEKLLPPTLVNSVASWCSRVTTIPSVNTTDLINSFSRIFNFRKDDWAWFSARYNLQLNDVNEDARKKSWYDRSSYQDQYSGRFGRRAGAVNASEPPAIVMPEDAAARAPVVEPAPAHEPEVVPVVNPSEPAPAVVTPEAEAVPAQAPAMTEPTAPVPAVAPVDQNFIDSSVQAPLPVPGESEKKAEAIPDGDAMMLPVSDAGSTPAAAPAEWQEKATATEAPVK